MAPYDAARAATLVGKYALVGLTYCNADGSPVRRIQVHGRIAGVDPTSGVTLHLHGSGEEFTLPPDLSAFEEAPPGEYRLRATGEVVIDPDLLARWTITAPEDDARRFEGDARPQEPGSPRARTPDPA